MNKRIRTGLVSTALIAGTFLGAGVVSAQADDTVTTDAPTVQTEADTTTTDTPADPPADEQPADCTEARHGRGGRHGADRGARGEALAALLGIDVDELKAASQAGETVADLAVANGVDVQTIIDAQVATVTEMINTAVENGRLTDVEAAEKIAGLEEKVTTRINEGRPERGERAERGERGERGDRPARDAAGGAGAEAAPAAPAEVAGS